MRDFVKNIHFIGIGGIGMSGIAEVLMERGFNVSGSDLSAGARTDMLQKQGATIYIGHDGANVADADVVVTSTAIDASNPEIAVARERNIPIVRRAEMLGELMRFKKGIAVSGTHGKTTTTSLISAVLVQARMDPTFIIGGVVKSERSNARMGHGDYLVAEADESDASFLHLFPNLAVITNIDRDHMDTYQNNFDLLKKTYVDFLQNLPFYGVAILCFEDQEIREIAQTLNKQVISYGLDEEYDYCARNISYHGQGASFELLHKGESKGEFQLAMPGEHNVLNALAAISVAYLLKVDVADIRAALAGFQGVARRFQSLGEIQIDRDDTQFEVQVVDDYAHHPSEISAVLSAASQCWQQHRVVCIFQPHRYSRTRDLFDDFVRVLSSVNNLILTEVYPAGEVPISEYDSRALSQSIRKRGGDPLFVASETELVKLLSRYLLPGDKLLIMGAGDIGRLGLKMVEAGNLKIFLERLEEVS